MDVSPFRIQVPEAVLQDLRERLGRTRWPDQVAGAGWRHGSDLASIQELAAYWRDRFDWGAQERALNAFHHRLARIDGLAIHFVHERGRGPRPFPLILTHGWPGCFAEMLKLVPLLTDPASHGGLAEDSFDVVIPSIPGFGFSERPPRPGLGNRSVALLWNALMRGLGYSRFGAQGGDWGAGISTHLARLHPESVAGIHLNYVPGSYRPDLGPGTAPLTAAEEEFLGDAQRWLEDEGGYASLQGTRPQTAAYGLNDSPAGLLAWIVEKLRAWSDCGGDLERRFGKDEILTHVTVYWATETIGSSMRFYRESRRTPLQLRPGERVPVPCGFAHFPLEAPHPPREWVERGYDVRRWTEMPRGGHFAAMEEPELLAEDVRAFFRPLRGSPRRAAAPGV
jgi:pimeloyl-ACP methyl ester carboxylesterase